MIDDVGSGPRSRSRLPRSRQLVESISRALPRSPPDALSPDWPAAPPRTLRGHRTRKPTPLAGDPQRARDRLYALRRVNRANQSDSQVSQRRRGPASSSTSGTYIAARDCPFQHHPGSAMLENLVARKSLRHALHGWLLVSAEVPPIDTVFPAGKVRWNQTLLRGKKRRSCSPD